MESQKVLYIGPDGSLYNEDGSVQSLSLEEGNGAIVSEANYGENYVIIQTDNTPGITVEAISEISEVSNETSNKEHQILDDFQAGLQQSFSLVNHMSDEQREQAISTLKSLLQKTPIIPNDELMDCLPIKKASSQSITAQKSDDNEKGLKKRRRGRPPKQLYCNTKPPDVKRVEGKLFYKPTRGRPPKDIITEEAVVIDKEELAQYSSGGNVNDISDNEEQLEKHEPEPVKSSKELAKDNLGESNAADNHDSSQPTARRSLRTPKPVKYETDFVYSRLSEKNKIKQEAIDANEPAENETLPLETGDDMHEKDKGNDEQHKTDERDNDDQETTLKSSRIKGAACDICGRYFSQKANMLRHYMRHTGERPYKCELCPASFIEKKSLVHHVERKHQGGELDLTIDKACKVCGKRFKSELQAARHPCNNIVKRTQARQKKSWPSPAKGNSQMYLEPNNTVLVGLEDLDDDPDVLEALAFNAQSASQKHKSNETHHKDKTYETSDNAAGEIVFSESVECSQDAEPTKVGDGENQEMDRTKDTDRNDSPDDRDTHQEEHVDTSYNIESTQISEGQNATLPEGQEEEKDEETLYKKSSLGSGDDDQLPDDVKCPVETDNNEWQCAYCAKQDKDYSVVYNHTRTHFEKAFTCKHCLRVFPTKMKLDRHYKVSHDIMPFVCRYCEQGFEKYGSLQKHLVIMHEEENNHDKTFCKVCERKYKTEASLKAHIAACHKNEVNECEFCHRKFSHAANLTRHLKIHTGERPHRCEKCGVGFIERKCLVLHLIRNHVEKGDAQAPLPDGAVTCELCGKGFANESALRMHALTHSARRAWSCSVCGKCFSLKSNMLRHEAKHGGARPFSCTVCGQTFTEKRSVTVHMRQHTGERPYVCEVCGKGFSQQSNLQAHLPVHTKKRQFHCSICGASFLRKSHQVIHMRRHQKDPHLKCASCNMAFYRNSDLHRHARTHTRDKPFRCGVCSRRFTRITYLKEHLNTHMGLKPFKCDICSACFAESSAFYKHRRTHSKPSAGRDKQADDSVPKRVSLIINKDGSVMAEHLLLASNNGREVIVQSSAETAGNEIVNIQDVEMMEDANNPSMIGQSSHAIQNLRFLPTSHPTLHSILHSDSGDPDQHKPDPSVEYEAEISGSSPVLLEIDATGHMPAVGSSDGQTILETAAETSGLMEEDSDEERLVEISHQGTIAAELLAKGYALQRDGRYSMEVVGMEQRQYVVGEEEEEEEGGQYHVSDDQEHGEPMQYTLQAVEEDQQAEYVSEDVVEVEGVEYSLQQAKDEEGGGIVGQQDEYTLQQVAVDSESLDEEQEQREQYMATLSPREADHEGQYTHANIETAADDGTSGHVTVQEVIDEKGNPYYLVINNKS